ncbi:MAG: aldo/keto reductase [Burkholderiaceae bacterium]|nr:aldo/keto reductase [Burkholderiaceae bacterium]
MPNLSPLVAGTWRLHEQGWSAAERLRWIERWADLGVTSFDHADIYGGYTVEALFGEALALRPALRERLQLVSKCGIRLPGHARGAARIKHYDSSAAHIRASVEHSLRALRTDRLDLLLLHRPDPLLDAAEVADAVAALQREGKILAFGVSNFGPQAFELLDAATPLATNQIELHPLRREPLHDGTLDALQRRGRRPMVWSPLAGGRLLAGDESPAAQRVRWVLGTLGAQLGVAPATVAYAWLLRHPTRPHPVVGTMREAGLQQALAALGLRLDAEAWTELWQAGAGHEVA